ncbi:MAG: hypothetical protein IPK80_01240 [Nannocystis sp.]|nr:hypothetical protein [Nannocystis sp.]
METAGTILAQAEGHLGLAIKNSVDHFYQGHDRETARLIRNATEDEAARHVEALRRGRALEVLLVGGSAVLGVVLGAVAQGVTNNFTMRGVPVMAPVGFTGLAGLALPVGLSGRTMVVTGGLAFSAGAALYQRLKAGESPKVTP